ncbi:hypothetical protein [Anaerotignum sp.]|uniref:hypothetical protein n=1 Tax=Anaerotignum sp. TaxID=2039241 RepID=UPI0028AF10F7|nr:hypothetical protein [Anaerotignum sp.]
MARYELVEKGKPVRYDATELKRYMDEVYPIPNFQEYVIDALAGELSSRAQNEFCKLIAKETGEKVFGYIGVVMTITDLIGALEDAILWEDLNGYFQTMNDNDTLEVRADIYLWESGSGNSHAYVTKMKYKLV